MTFLRAAENINLKTMKKCADAYPYLKSLCNPDNLNIRISNDFLQIKEHAVELARNAITSELTALQGNAELLDPQVKARKKENILTRIKRLLPGSLGGLNAMRNEAGEITTDPKAIASILDLHWSKVFSKRGIDDVLLQQWLREEFGEVGEAGLPEASRWKVTRKHIAKAIRMSGNSPPGPDKIPYKAWKALGELGVTILHDMAWEMQKDNSVELIITAYDHPDHTGSHDFNTGLLCCLPKKATGVHEIHGEFYGAGDTRPLAIVNTDNRLIASAMRLAWEPLLNSWISKAQRGFLKGRSILMNILDIDEKAMTVSLKEAYGGLVLF